MNFLKNWDTRGTVNKEINNPPESEFTYTLNEEKVNLEVIDLIGEYLYKKGEDYKLRHSLSKTYVCIKTQSGYWRSSNLNFTTLISPYTISLNGLNSLSKSIIVNKIKTFANTILCPSFYLIKKDMEILIGCSFECIKKHINDLLMELNSLFDPKELKNTNNFSEIKMKFPRCIMNRINIKREQKEDVVYNETFTVEYIKLIYILYYKSGELEKILEEFDCFLNYEFPVTSSMSSYKLKKTYLNNKFPSIILEPVALQILSKTNTNIFQIKTNLNFIFNKIILFVGNFQNILFPSDVFVFKINVLDLNYDIKDMLKSKLETPDTLIIGNLDILKYFSNFEVTYFHTLNKDDFDFVLGKKNGKINKIIKSCENTSISLFPSLYDFQNLENNKLSTLIVNTNNLSYIYESLIDEQPESLIFSIPGFFHKRIIGFGGKNIQKIMKKYGVYVKFMTPVESIGFNGNVLIKTPSKNKQNLFKMKDEILKLVKEISSDHNNQRINLSLSNFKIWETKDNEIYSKKFLLKDFLMTDFDSYDSFKIREPSSFSGSIFNYFYDVIFSSYGLDFYKSKEEEMEPRNIDFLVTYEHFFS